MPIVLDFLKYGPIGLAAIACFYAAYLLTTVTKKPKVDPQIVRVVNNFMVFCVALLVISIGANILDAVLVKRDQRITNIREQISRLDEQEVNKYQTFRIHDRNQSAGTLVQILKPTVKRMCGAIVAIAKEVEGAAPSCTEVVQLPD